MRSNSRWRLPLFFVRLWADEGGQGTVEYIILLSASVTGAVAVARALISALDTGMLKLGAQLEQDLKTGRIGLNAWTN